MLENCTEQIARLASDPVVREEAIGLALTINGLNGISEVVRAAEKKVAASRRFYFSASTKVAE